MSEGLGYIALFFFFFLLASAVVGETIYLRRKGWTTLGKAFSFVLTTDLVGLAVGGTVAFVALIVMFMMIMGPAGRGGNAPEWVYWLVAGIASAISGLFLVLFKRLGLRLFEIRSGGGAWIYSGVSTVISVLVILVPPPLIYLVISGFTQWKK